MGFEFRRLAWQVTAVQYDLGLARPRQFVEGKIRLGCGEQGRPGVRERTAEDDEVSRAERPGMHLTRLPDGRFPATRLQISGNAVGVLKISDVGDLARGETAPEAEKILFESQLGDIQIGQVLVFLQGEPAI